jgi:hypothetical protein
MKPAAQVTVRCFPQTNKWVRCRKSHGNCEPCAPNVRACRGKNLLRLKPVTAGQL